MNHIARSRMVSGRGGQPARCRPYGLALVGIFLGLGQGHVARADALPGDYCSSSGQPCSNANLPPGAPYGAVGDPGTCGAALCYRSMFGVPVCYECGRCFAIPDGGSSGTGGTGGSSAPKCPPGAGTGGAATGGRGSGGSSTGGATTGGGGTSGIATGGRGGDGTGVVAATGGHSRGVRGPGEGDGCAAEAVKDPGCSFTGAGTGARSDSVSSHTLQMILGLLALLAARRRRKP
jgi:hypothetical protein